MKFRRLILAATLLTAATGFAVAQSAPSPNNSSGPDVHANTPSPTDLSSTGDNIKGIPSRGTAVKGRATTGAGMTEPGTKPSSQKNMNETMKKNASPASPAEGEQKEK
jgi:hypothetical protein